MEDINDNLSSDAKLEIYFPKSSEDHRLQLVAINESIFAIVHSPLETLGPIRLQCESWSLVLLSPLKSKSNILISAINVICLNEIASEEGFVNIHASNRLVKFKHSIQSPKPISEMGERGEFQFDDDPGAFLFYYRLFDSILTNVRNGSLDSLSQAQQQFIMAFSTLADKIEGGPENLDLHKVLDIWNIPHLKS